MKRSSPLRSIGSALLAMAVMLCSPSLLAQPYPNKPIRIVVPHPPGGAVDGVARILATRLTESLGQSVLVENRAGASGTIGAEFVARSPADGYTLYVNASIHAINPQGDVQSWKFEDLLPSAFTPSFLQLETPSQS